mgnify:CR=1 FL=1
MAEASIRDLRNHGGDIVERAARGEVVTITRAGTPVAQLSALPERPLPPDVLLERFDQAVRDGLVFGGAITGRLDLLDDHGHPTAVNLPAPPLPHRPQ